MWKSTECAKLFSKLAIAADTCEHARGDKQAMHHPTWSTHAHCHIP